MSSVVVTERCRPISLLWRKKRKRKTVMDEAARSEQLLFSFPNADGRCYLHSGLSSSLRWKKTCQKSVPFYVRPVIHRSSVQTIFPTVAHRSLAVAKKKKEKLFFFRHFRERLSSVEKQCPWNRKNKKFLRAGNGELRDSLFPAATSLYINSHLRTLTRVYFEAEFTA